MVNFTEKNLYLSLDLQPPSLRREHPALENSTFFKLFCVDRFSPGFGFSRPKSMLILADRDPQLWFLQQFTEERCAPHPVPVSVFRIRIHVRPGFYYVCGSGSRKAKMIHKKVTIFYIFSSNRYGPDQLGKND
jgi:hypothetical protein